MDRYFVSNRTWNITTLGLLYRGRVGLSVVWVLTGATYVQRLEKFLIGLWSKKKKKEEKIFPARFQTILSKRVHAKKWREGGGEMFVLRFWKVIFIEFWFSFAEGKKFLSLLK